MLEVMGYTDWILPILQKQAKGAMYKKEILSIYFFPQYTFKSCIWTSVAFTNSSFLQESNVTFIFLFKIKIPFALSPFGFYAENPSYCKTTPTHNFWHKC